MHYYSIVVDITLIVVLDLRVRYKYSVKFLYFLG